MPTEQSDNPGLGTERLINYNVIQCNTMAMEIVTIKFEEDVLKRVDKSITEHNFNSRTEFIREAVRDKLAELSKEDLIKEFIKYRGKAKKKTTYEENRKTREIVSKELMEELDKRFS
jgi:Arc/MetJ-type ribon-helix-helix transcriptional regulator